MKKTVTMILMVLASTMAGAQDLASYKQVIKDLSSAKYQGRGYAKNGANKAGKYLQQAFEKAGVDEVTLQPFKLNINSFCGKMQMWADGKELRAGVDFSMREYSPGVKGEFPVYHVDTLNYARTSRNYRKRASARMPDSSTHGRHPSNSLRPTARR